MKNVTRLILSVLLAILLVETLPAQNKIVFRKGMKRAVIKKGKTIGITEKGEPWQFKNWKNICSGCYKEGCIDSIYNRTLYFDSTYYYDRDCGDTNCYNNMWMLYTVNTDSITLVRYSDDSTDYRYDTVPYYDLGRYERRLKKQPFWLFDSWFNWADSIPGHYSYVYAIPVHFTTRIIPMDSIESFTFAEMDNCQTFDLGTVLLAATAIIGAPIAATDGGGWPAFIVGEAVGGYFVWGMYKNIQDLKVKRYFTDEWKVKVK